MDDSSKSAILDHVGSQPVQFTRALGLWSAVAVNMTQICGIGPFITIPLIVSTMGGPQAILGAGGTYLYLREAFQYRTGRLMPFLFIWTIMLAIPLCMSTGVIGLVDYVGFYFPNMGP